jgi:uncharacterized coiled-coil DUF342 family protein
MQEDQMKTKEEYIQFLHQKIDEWNSDIDKLREKADKLDSKSREELNEQILNLKRKRDEIELKATELSKSGSDAWQDLKSGIDLAWDAMNVAVKSASSRFFK